MASHCGLSFSPLHSLNLQNLAQCYLFLFLRIKKNLKGRCLHDEEAIKTAPRRILDDISKLNSLREASKSGKKDLKSTSHLKENTLKETEGISKKVINEFFIMKICFFLIPPQIRCETLCEFLPFGGMNIHYSEIILLLSFYQ